MKKILLIGSQHGNEILGEQLYNHLKDNYPSLCAQANFMTGNPRARKLRVRYVESDMNRSYITPAKTYEQRRAKYVHDYIQKHNFDLILDLHTTNCVQPPCLIISEISDLNVSFIRATNISKIVVMEHTLVKTSLIGVCPQVVSIEVNNKQLNSKLLKSLSCDINRTIKQKAATRKKFIYNVNELLLKSELSSHEIATLVNFKKFKGQFYPVLTGNNSYKKIPII